jgi:hypothetical protein
MKSSIDFLIDQLNPYICFPSGDFAGYNTKDVFDRAKEMHKDEIMDAFRYGNNNEILGKKHPEEYYNDTFTE